jgi:hypothetical protein
MAEEYAPVPMSEAQAQLRQFVQKHRVDSMLFLSRAFLVANAVRISAVSFVSSVEGEAWGPFAWRLRGLRVCWGIGWQVLYMLPIGGFSRICYRNVLFAALAGYLYILYSNHGFPKFNMQVRRVHHCCSQGGGRKPWGV